MMSLFMKAVRPKLIRFQLRTPEGIRARLNQYAVNAEKTVNQCVNEAIREYLERHREEIK